MILYCIIQDLQWMLIVMYKSIEDHLTIIFPLSFFLVFSLFSCSLFHLNGPMRLTQSYLNCIVVELAEYIVWFQGGLFIAMVSSCDLIVSQLTLGHLTISQSWQLPHKQQLCQVSLPMNIVHQYWHPLKVLNEYQLIMQNI